jgi:hypothetical protein
MNRILALSAAALFGVSMLAAPVSAQTAGTTGDGGDRTTLTGPDATGATGFNVHGFWQVRPDAEIRAHYDTLTPAERDQLRAECTRLEAGEVTLDANWVALCERVQTF